VKEMKAELSIASQIDALAESDVTMVATRAMNEAHGNRCGLVGCGWDDEELAAAAATAAAAYWSATAFILPHVVNLTLTQCSSRSHSYSIFGDPLKYIMDVGYPVPKYMSHDQCEAIVRKYLPSAEAETAAQEKELVSVPRSRL
jgi:hypothetical protein